MKILSWNIYNFNSNPSKALEYILSSDADLICLQEVSNTMYTSLKTKYIGSIFRSLDFIENGIEHYLVILTKTKVKSFEKKELNKGEKVSLVQKIFNWKEALSYQYVDIEEDDKRFRVFNLHLTNGSGMSKRSEELRTICKDLDNYSDNVLCGDFNTFLTPTLSFIIRYFYSLKKQDLNVTELNEFDKNAKLYRLEDAFKGKYTFDLLGIKFKLDHILLPMEKYKYTPVVENSRHGSDHYPITVSLL